MPDQLPPLAFPKPLTPVAATLALLAATLASWSPGGPRSAHAADAWTLDQMVGRDAQGRPTYHGRPLEQRFTNPISDADEADFQARARRIIEAQGALKVAAGNTYFENEKRTYGYLMARVSEQDGVTFLEADRTWIAIRPLGTTSFTHQPRLTAEIAGGQKPAFPDHQVLAAHGQEKTFCGLAVEIGEPDSHHDLASFKRHVLAAEIDLSKLQQGIVQYRAADGAWLGFHWNDDPRNLGVWRNGVRHDWTRHAAHLYLAASSDPGPAANGDRAANGGRTAAGHPVRPSRRPGRPARSESRPGDTSSTAESTMTAA